MFDNLQISGAIKEKFTDWWKQDNGGRPLMHICIDQEMGSAPMDLHDYFATEADIYTHGPSIVKYYEAFAKRHSFMAEGFMDYKLNFGPGSMALYVGGEGVPKWESFWFKEMENAQWDGLLNQPFSMENSWLVRHLDLFREVRALTDGQVLLPMPDIVESIDTMSALRGAQSLCFDFILGDPANLQQRIDAIDAHYLKVFDAFHQVVSQETGGNGHAGFKVWGAGKTVKMQCDFCAMMNPSQIAQFLIPSLKKESAYFNNAFYHLDGVDAARHIDLFMDIADMKAIQWTHGVCKPDGLWEGWYEPIYDKVMDGGKSLYILVDQGNVDDWISGIRKLVNRYGSKSLFIRFLEPMSQSDGNALLSAVDRM